MEWIVAAALALAGLLTAVGLWLGQRDPVTRHYKPDMGGLFRIGRSGYLPSTARCATTISMAAGNRRHPAHSLSPRRRAAGNRG